MAPGGAERGSSPARGVPPQVIVQMHQATGFNVHDFFGYFYIICMFSRMSRYVLTQQAQLFLMSRVVYSKDSILGAVYFFSFQSPLFSRLLTLTYVDLIHSFSFRRA